MRSLLAAVSMTLMATVAQAQVTIKATNNLPIARASQTIELSGKDLATVGARDLSFIHIKDASGKEVLAQAVDTDFDEMHAPDMVIFQADFAPNESKTFTASPGGKLLYNEDQIKAHGRFVRERFDDFCWENDKIAHRMYGKALETWKGEPLTSSSIDIWSKKTPKMVIDKWYMVDDYHADHGEGADFYSAGATRGDGGSGIWANDQLYVSKNFVDSRVLTNGPIRVMFELVYEPFDVNGMKVSEVKRISLDAGSQLDHLKSTYKIISGEGPLMVGIGMKKTNGQEKAFDDKKGTLTGWERVEKNAGMQGLGIIVDPANLTKQAEDRTNTLLIVKADANHSISYWAGFCWDKAGQITSYEAWKKYVEDAAEGAASPIEVSVGK
ncbi:MAG TPA: DUF4861 family protein [Tepidisphaeraceae bacterium]|nr:DUF4861 family protein [Tepidisphaeraceae bacterium]